MAELELGLVEVLMLSRGLDEPTTCICDSFSASALLAKYVVALISPFSIAAVPNYLYKYIILY
jgi:hypothetical protein